jgi:hypothetical protein
MDRIKSNIEATARAVCERPMRAAGAPENELLAVVDRYWHCVAAAIEAELIDPSGQLLLPFDFVVNLEAYRDWCRRHPTGEVG